MRFVDTMLSKSMNEQAERTLTKLMRGNERFRSGVPRAAAYTADDFAAFGRGQSPQAAVITCSDSRVAPEILFDQPLGSFLVARVPGNVASASVRWMLDIAVCELSVPLVLVVGHTGCRAVEQVIQDKPSARHEELQVGIHTAMERVRESQPRDYFRSVVMENARQTVLELSRDVPALREAAQAGTTAMLPALYEVETGRVLLL